VSNRGISVILVAAGRGERLGASVPKALAELAGETLLAHSVRAALLAKGLKQLVIAAPEHHIEEFAEIVRSVADSLGSLVPIRLVIGGETRQLSIAAAIKVCDEDVDGILVHDVARSLAPSALFDRVAEAVAEQQVGIVPILAVVDTMKRIDGNVVAATVDRTQLGSAQTPQGFPAETLRTIYRSAVDDYTDDAALFQSFGFEVRSVVGEQNAFKITTPSDLARAASLFDRDYRSGIGTDTHRFSADASKPLFLGTIVWDGEIGLDGHSDGDALSHAIVDALLSAAGLGDIGSNFGVDREEFAGANGSVFLTEARSLLQSSGWQIENVSAQIIGNKPKVAPHRSLVQLALSETVGAPVTVSATTTDGLGFLGQSEGVAVVATALISRLKVRLNS
jgi:2-C-methyl-D-erythritol 4-phosphate cytidylyltransferase/2-C-methyl-D-erythritol 2,4-cyclodiphosphate synthase